MSRVYSQTIYAMNTKDTSTKIFEFRKWILLIKPHMRNRMTVGGLSSNLEESIKMYTLINLQRSILHLQMSTWNMPERKAWPSLPKKRLTLWGRSKHVVVNVIILYMRSISLSFVKQVKQTHKQCFCIFLLSLNMLRVVNVLPCVCVRRFSKENLLVILLRI